LKEAIPEEIFKLEPLMKIRKRTFPQAAGSILNGALREMGLSSSLARQSIVVRWPEIVASAVAKHARAERLVGDTLYVVVDSSVWMNELSAIRLTLLDKLNAWLGPGIPKIREIRFGQVSWRRGELKEANDQPAPSSAKVEPDEKSLRISRSNINLVKDEEVRKIIERLIYKDARLQATKKISSK
jgi:hypothetical protein